ncbi:hypothetical protein AAHE18_14G161000 [Arachis hypogaea]
MDYVYAYDRRGVGGRVKLSPAPGTRVRCKGCGIVPLAPCLVFYPMHLATSVLHPRCKALCGRVLHDELCYDRCTLAEEHNNLLDQLTNEQKLIAILAPILQLSSDKACPTENNNGILASVHTPEFLNTIRCSGVPNHELRVKVETPIMLLRNIDHSAGLCNGTRLVITKLDKHIIEAKGISGKNVGKKVFIPRMTLSFFDHRIPFKFQRRYQGQSLSKVGLILRKPVFTHGQLYVAVSRVTNRKGLKILLCHDEDKSNETDNVVYKEVFRNLG